MSDTLFAYLKGALSNGSDVADPENAPAFYYPPMAATHNVTMYRRETLELDDTDTRTVTFPAAAASGDWIGIMARVIGEATLTTIGVNWDGSTAVTGVTAGYGVEQYPGMISLVTKNVTSLVFTALADDTQIDYVAMILAADDDI